MRHLISASVLAALATLPALAQARAGEAMRCVSVNGNINCSASGAASCQSINGRTVCIAGGGAVMQSFGAGRHGAQDDAIRIPDDIDPGDDSP